MNKHERYRLSEKGRKTRARYRSAPEVRERERNLQRARRKRPEVAAKIRAYRRSRAGKLASWRAQLKYKYGLTEQQFHEMFVAQGQLCAIGREPLGLNEAVVDHDHKTGKVRALLCSPCNTLIGFARERTDTLRQAIAYLEKHGAA